MFAVLIPSRLTLRDIFGTVLILVSALSCESASAPKDDDRTMTIGMGSLAQGGVGAGDTNTFSLHASAGDVFVVYVEALDSGVAATVLNPHGQFVGGAFHFGPGAPGALAHPVLLVDGALEGNYTIRVHTGLNLRGGRFVLRVNILDTAPEASPPLIRQNDTISTETLDYPGDIDEFQFDGEAGQEVNLFLQSLSPLSGPINATIISPAGSDPFGGSYVGDVTVSSAEADIESRASGRRTLPVTGRYRIRIKSAATGGHREARESYRFQVYRINRAPERLPVALSIGDTVSEGIEHVGDVDEFTLTAAAGRRFNIFVEANGVAPHAVVASVNLGSDSTYGSLDVVAKPGDHLLDNPTGTFVIPSSGTIQVRVSDKEDSGGLYRGGYRLFVYPIDPAPEHGPTEIVPSHTPVNGAIDQYGDVDEFAFTIGSKTAISLRSNAPGNASKPSVAIAADNLPGGQDRDGVLDPGAYHVRVSAGRGTRADFRGAYQFVLAPVDYQPEVASATLAVGDTVRTETLAWPWDIDQFRLASGGTDTVVVELRTPNVAGWTNTLDVAEGGVRTFLLYQLGPGVVGSTTRIDLSPEKSITLSLDGSNAGWSPGADAEYQLVIKRVSAAPEHRSPIIALGDTIRDSLDFSGDIDDFILHGTPGQDINVSAASPFSQAPPYFVVTLLDAATGAKLAAVRSLIDYGYSQNTKIPASGAVRVRACVGSDCIPRTCDDVRCPLGAHPLLSYWLVVNAVNRAPESISPIFAIGDTVAGEKVENPGDIDEFQFNGVAGQKISAQLQWLSGVPSTSMTLGVQLELVDVVTGDVLGTLTSDYEPARLEDNTLPAVTLPRTGEYMVRVQSHSDPAYGFRNYGPYRFRVVAVP